MSAGRLSLGLFTIIPAGMVTRVDRGTARRAMLLAPLVGLLLGALAAIVLVVVDHLVPSDLGALLAAALAVGALAYLTRALHLDGLADTADALGSGRSGEEALVIARRGDVGPFGVVTLVVALLIDVAALAVIASAGLGAVGLIVAVVTGRLAATVACARGIPAASSGGLGALVASSVPRSAAAAWVVAAAASAAAAVWWASGQGAHAAVVGAVAVIAGLIVALGLVRRARRRLGGISGDVLGASVEVATTASLLVLALGATVGA